MSRKAELAERALQDRVKGILYTEYVEERNHCLTTEFTLNKIIKATCKVLVPCFMS